MGSYTPVAARTGGAPTTGYVPVASRTAAPAADSFTANLAKKIVPLGGGNDNQFPGWADPSPLLADQSARAFDAPVMKTSTSPTELAPGSSFVQDSAKDIVQAPFRAAATITKAINDKAGAKILPSLADTQGSFTDLFAGTDPIKPLSESIRETQKGLADFGLPNSVATPFGAFTAVGSLALDAAPLGGEKNALKAIAEVKDFAEAVTMARKIGVHEDLVQTAAEAFLKAKNPEEAKAAVASIENLQRNSKPSYTPVSARPAAAAASPEEAAARYYQSVIAPAKESGRATIISADNIKDLYRDYNDNNHPTYSKAAYQNYTQVLKENPHPEVAFTAGGPGSGKTEILVKTIDRGGFDGIIYDSNMSSIAGATRQIEDARAAGKSVKIYALLPDLERSRQFTVEREAATGRGISDKTFAKSHAAVPEVLRTLLENGTLKPEEVKLFDMRDKPPLQEAIARVLFGETAEDPLAVLNNVRYNEEDLQKLYGRETPIIERDRENPAIRAGDNQGVDTNRPAGGPASDGRAAPGGDTKTVGEAAGKPAAAGSKPLTQAQKDAERAAYAQRNEGRKSAPAGTRISGKKEKFSPNLLKTISESRSGVDIAAALSERFPKLSDRAIDAIAKRLRDVKRTPDIEGVLNHVAAAEKAIASKSKLAKSSAVTPGLSSAVGDILTPEERDAYMDSATRAIADPEDAVLAQQEYDALWEQADQKVLDRFNELNIMRDIYREQTDIHPGKQLMKYVSKTTGRLPEITGSEFMKSLTGNGKDVRTSEFGRSGDSIAQELGFESGEQAQKAVDDYTSMRDSLKDINKEIRELRPQARATRFLQAMQADVPVITRKDAANIDSLTSGDTVRYDYRDITGFQGAARDLYRNFEAFFGKRFPEIKKIILDPFDASKGAMIDEVTKLGDEIENGIVKKYGFARGSRESRAIMDYGERAITKDEKVPGIDFENTTRDGLVRKFGPKKADQIIEAEGWFRKEYDRLIDEANTVRAAIYPNNPAKLIPKRGDYFRHFQELGTTFRDLLSLFETPAGIDPKLAGISEFTSPKSKFLSFAQERVGQGSERDAIGGFLNYAPSFAYMKHIDPHIGQFRYLRRQLAENAPTPGVTEILEKGGTQVKTRQKGINNFLTYLNHFSNDLAGKTNPAERYIQEVIPGGRTAMKVINWVNSRIKANQILGNLSSSLAQAFNLPQGIASAKLYMLPGATRTLAGMFEKDAPMAASAFLKERYAQPLTSRFKLDWVTHPIKGSTERTKDAAAWLTQALDEVATKWTWNAHYDKALAEHIENPVKYADDVTRRLVAGRGVGEVPLLQKSKIFQLAAPFTLEVGNAWSVMKEFAKGKNGNPIATLAVFFVASYLMNEGAQQVRGSRVVFDPINSLLEGLSQAQDEANAGDDPVRIGMKFAGRQLGEMLSNIPLGSTFAAAVPDQFTVLGQTYQRKEFFGSGDPGRYGNPLLTISAFSDPLYKLFPPFGGAQVKRTQQAVQSMIDGEVKTAAGATSFKTPTGALSVMQAFLFGKNATSEAQHAYDTRDDLFNRVYAQDASRSQLTLDGEQAWADIKSIKQKDGGPAASAKLASIAKENPDLAQKIVDIAADEAKGLTGNDRLIKQLGIANGERAKYLALSLDKMKTPQEKTAYITDLAGKKLLPKDVIDQLAYLLKK